jgi:Zn-dependent protease with chaperone function
MEEISAGTLEQLHPAALDAALAHEPVHAARHDPLWGYVLIAARALTFFNPATQWLARAAVDDIERRTDQAALRLVRDPEALARAVRVLSLAATPTSREVGDRYERLFWQSRVAAVHRRCDRLLETSLAVPLRHGTLRVLLTAAGLGILLFFVV